MAFDWGTLLRGISGMGSAATFSALQTQDRNRDITADLLQQRLLKQNIDYNAGRQEREDAAAARERMLAETMGGLAQGNIDFGSLPREVAGQPGISTFGINQARDAEAQARRDEEAARRAAQQQEDDMWRSIEGDATRYAQNAATSLTPEQMDAATLGRVQTGVANILRRQYPDADPGRLNGIAADAVRYALSAGLGSANRQSIMQNRGGGGMEGAINRVLGGSLPGFNQTAGQTGAAGYINQQPGTRTVGPGMATPAGLPSITPDSAATLLDNIMRQNGWNTQDQAQSVYEQIRQQYRIGG
jgi:hypothetical protein